MRTVYANALLSDGKILFWYTGDECKDWHDFYKDFYYAGLNMIEYEKSQSSAFTMEWDTPILVQARWHKKARIRKKWLKRYGFVGDVVKTVAKANCGDYNKETGETNIDVDSIQYIWRPDQLRRGLKIIGASR